MYSSLSAAASKRSARWLMSEGLNGKQYPGRLTRACGALPLLVGAIGAIRAIIVIALLYA
jgi:hypothetical protein